jgi:predicted benzoate:H+ symporter BenE
MVAWGLLDDASKPWWYGVALVLTAPGVLFPPYISAPFWGGVMGFGLVWLTRRIRSRRPPSIPPRL